MDDKVKRRPNELSLSRVKTIMKSSPDVENVSQESVFLVTKATEMFIKHMVEEAYTASGNAGSLEYKHVSDLVQTTEELGFLREIVPRKCTLREIEEYQKQKGLKVQRPGETTPPSEICFSSDESLDLSPKDKISSTSLSLNFKDPAYVIPEASSSKEFLASKLAGFEQHNIHARDTSLSTLPLTITSVRRTDASTVSREVTSSKSGRYGESSASSPKKSKMQSTTNRQKTSIKETGDVEFADMTTAEERSAKRPMEPICSPGSAVSLSSESRTSSPSPSYSSLSPEPSSVVPADDASSHSSDCEIIDF